MRKARYTDDFVIREAEFILNTYATYRQTSIKLGAPISTAGWHMKKRLKRIDPMLHEQVMGVIKINWRERLKIQAQKNGGDQ